MRCAVIGNQNVGKSSLIQRYVKGTYSDNGHPVIPTVQYHYKDDIKNGNFNIKLEIMDTPGIDNYEMVYKFSLKYRAFVFLVFDVSDKESFNNLEDFIEKFNNKNINPNKLLFIVGNKTDKEARQVTNDEGEELADNYGVKYFETSAKSGKNVDDLFKKALDQICKNLRENTYTPGINLEKFGIKEFKA
jgi:small GTP-binding protein